MAVDSLLWFLMFTMILELLVGDKPGGGILRSISAEEGLRSIFILSWFFGSYFIYTALPEYIMGTTIGGLVFGSRVVNEYGNKLTFWQIIKRQIKRIFAPILLIFWQSRDNEIVNY